MGTNGCEFTIDNTDCQRVPNGVVACAVSVVCGILEAGLMTIVSDGCWIPTAVLIQLLKGTVA
jgi:hypothetical protein